MNDEKVRPFLTRPAVIDWLQWNDFGEHLVKPDMAQVALSLIEEYRVALRESQAEATRLREAVIQINHGDGYYSHHKAIFQDGHPGTDRMVIHAGEQFEAESEALKETKP